METAQVVSIAMSCFCIGWNFCLLIYNLYLGRLISRKERTNRDDSRATIVERALEIAEELGELCSPAQNYIEMAEKEFEENDE